jgi:S-methylmethionine-dependent homocysteine/selenocysteine methylase
MLEPCERAPGAVGECARSLPMGAAEASEPVPAASVAGTAVSAPSRVDKYSDRLGFRVANRSDKLQQDWKKSAQPLVEVSARIMGACSCSEM